MAVNFAELPELLRGPPIDSNHGIYREFPCDAPVASHCGHIVSRLAQARAKVARVITRMEQGNLANVKSVGQGVLEYKIDFGPGYRVYFARDGETLLILLTGGTKKRQQRDINAAITYWQDYKRGKRGIR
jgi:putative addiction module killer protein